MIDPKQDCDVAESGDCIGDVEAEELSGGVLALCQFHWRELSEIGEDAFREWYSPELTDD